MGNNHQDRKLRVEIMAWLDALRRGARMSGVWAWTVVTVIFNAFATATVVWAVFSNEPAEIARVIALIALIALIVFALVQAPYRGQKAMTDEVREELRELRSGTQELSTWAEAQRQNFQQYVHAHAEDYQVSAAETLFYLRMCNALYANLTVNDVEGRFFAGDKLVGRVRLAEQMVISRGASSRIPLSTQHLTAKGSVEFRGRILITVFGNSRRLEYTSPGLNPIWEVGAGE